MLDYDDPIPSLMRHREPTFRHTAERLNFPMIDRRFADAMRVNRRPLELVMTPQDWRDDRMPERAVVQIKWDGIHALYRRDAAWPVTREGVDMTCAAHLMPGLVALTVALKHLFGTEHAVVGEYTHIDGFEATLREFRRGTHIDNASVLHVFDAIPLAAYEGREPSPPLIKRLARMERAFDMIRRDAGGVTMARSTVFEGDARENIVAMMPELWAQGIEGIVVKDADSPYVRASSPFWQRIKRRDTLDVPITGVDAHGGRLKAIAVRLDRGQICRVGVGFSEAQRASPADFRTGRIVEIRHLGRTANGLLRSPVFVRFRDDKGAP